MCIPQTRVAYKQRKRMEEEPPVRLSLLATKSIQRQLSKFDGDEVDYVKAAIAEVCVECIGYFTAL